MVSSPRWLLHQLEKLVDDYLAKHEAAVNANNARMLVLRECRSQKEKDAALAALITAHNARTAAFHALRNARKKG